jgi:hypothetical protein
MKDKSAIEARLHRSLTNQVAVPRLERRFDAGVWARIEAEQSRATAVRPGEPKASRWMSGINRVGVAVAVLLMVFFGAQALSGVDLGVNIAMPEISSATVEQLVKAAMWPITGVALLIGLSFTSLGRRLRAEFT